MATAVETAITEITTHQGVVGPQYAGFVNLARLSLNADAQREDSFSIEQYKRRIELMRNAKIALEALVADGYPDLDVREIPDGAYEDILEQAKGINAALAQFSSGRATGITVTAGLPEPKA